MKHHSMKSILIFAGILFCSLTSFSQTLKTPAPSPTATLDQNFALSNIKIEYSRPSVKGRVIFGDLVPFGKAWRTGANSATKITFGEDVKVEGSPVPAGTYAMYTIPGKEMWEFVLNKDLTLGGAMGDYKAENDVLHFKVKPASMSSKVESFTIEISNITASSANVDLMWDMTKVSFTVTADDDAKIMKSIDKALEADTRPFFSAANYYYENNKDLMKALEWTNKAIEINPKAYYMVHLKAKIYMKQKDYKNAIAAAEQSMNLAREAKSDDYVSLNEKLIAEAKKQK